MGRSPAKQYRDKCSAGVCAAAVLLAGLFAGTSIAQESSGTKPAANTTPPAATSEELVSPTGQRLIPLATVAQQEDLVVEDHDGNISLVVRDGSLRQVVALIAETQNLNLVFAGPTDVQVTASFDQIPWQRALDALLSASGHTWNTTDGIIFITGLDAAGGSSPVVSGHRVEVFELDFAAAVDVDLAVKGLLSPSGQSWLMETSPTDNRRTRELVAVADFPPYLQRISEFICQTDQPPRQVLIEVHILQVDLNKDCRSGVNFEQISSFSGNELKLTSAGFASGAASPAFFIEGNGAGLTSLVELLQTTTDVKTLASPRLLAISGQESRIQIGDQLGYRITTTTQTSTLESVEFLDVGVVLSIRPRITRDGRVLMHVKPEVSKGEVDTTTGLPAEETTEVETDVLLNDGQGMVIGGLIQERDSNIQSKIPWLGDIPYVGVLFQRRQLVKEKSEIIVALVPHILPYNPILAEREQTELMRTEEPLLTGPLNRHPRPYEAMLPDTFDNPTPVRMARSYEPVVMMPAEPQLIRLPPVDDAFAVPTLLP